MDVAVVGAGAAGLSFAHYLRERRGIRATVFEASDRIGGKCASVAHDGESYAVGAILVGAGYHHVLALAEQLGARLVPGPRHILVGADGRRRPFGPMEPSGRSVGEALAFARLARLLLQKRVLGAPGFRDIAADLALPISVWLRKHRLEALAPQLLALFSGYGYGLGGAAPMAYLMKLLQVIVPRSRSAFRRWSWAKRAAGAPASLWLEGMMLEDGYHGLFERLAATVDVRRRCPVASVSRSGEGGRVAIRTADGAVSTFDRVVLAVDPSVLLAILDCDAEERGLFECVRYSSYRSLLCEVDAAAEAEARFLEEHVDRAGRLLVLSVPVAGRGVGVAYATSGAPEDELEIARLATDAAHAGRRLVSVVSEQRWRYFPHVAPPDFRTFYDALEARQGRAGTFVAGEVMSFASVEHVCEYSRALVEDRF